MKSIETYMFINLIKPREIHTLRSCLSFLLQESFTTTNYDDNEDDEEDIPLPSYPLVKVDVMTPVDLTYLITVY